MAQIRMSPEVRATIGAGNARAIDDRTVELGEAAQCWWCGGVTLLGPNDPGDVALSVLAPRPDVFVTLFGHADCQPSQVVDEALFDSSPAQHIPATVKPLPDRVIIDGRPLDTRRREATS